MMVVPENMGEICTFHNYITILDLLLAQTKNYSLCFFVTLDIVYLLLIILPFVGIFTFFASLFCCGKSCMISYLQVGADNTEMLWRIYRNGS
jgi:hypothetical protein